MPLHSTAKNAAAGGTPSGGGHSTAADYSAVPYIYSAVPYIRSPASPSPGTM